MQRLHEGARLYHCLWRDRGPAAGGHGFFIPDSLIRFEYLRSDSGKKQSKEEKEYQKERELAWYVVHLGMSKSEYQEFTPAELAFIRKEWENAVVFDSTLTRDAVLNATYNANRKKGKRFRKLWTKLGKITQTEKKTYEDTKKRILDMEKENPTNWVEKIYEANGWLKKKGGRNDG